jgi:hypothetical protein
MPLSDLAKLVLVEAHTGQPARAGDKPLLRHGNARPDEERIAIWEASQELADQGLVLVVRADPRVQIKRVLDRGALLAEQIQNGGELDSLAGL